jgi:uncharacterized protein YegL
MPRLGSESLQKHNGGHFQFSATRIADLEASGSSAYTLVTIIADRSGSTSGFQTEMEAALKSIVDACQKSDRADNLMIRVITFDSQHKEEHGFKLLSSIVLDDYNGILAPGGMTALYDAAVDGIEATNTYGRQLLEKDFDVNGIVFVITDGGDNESSNGINQVNEALTNAVTGENLESMVSILIGVNIQSHQLQQLLDDFHKQAGFTQFVPLADANKNTLAKLAQFVSKSISSQSQYLGTGGPSASIVF